jgi:DNA-binding NarL/FixJ family response regulator
MKVLIADDSVEVRERIKMLLSDVGMLEMIGEAGNVQQAIEQIEKKTPDVVILDIRIPGGNGIDVLKKIGKKDRIPVVIMLTNYPYAQYKRKCMDAGADFFFDKSKEFEKVAEVLSGYVQKTSDFFGISS